jgi:hypothetical protein
MDPVPELQQVFSEHYFRAASGTSAANASSDKVMNGYPPTTTAETPGGGGGGGDFAWAAAAGYQQESVDFGTVPNGYPNQQTMAGYPGAYPAMGMANGNGMDAYYAHQHQQHPHHPHGGYGYGVPHPAVRPGDPHAPPQYTAQATVITDQHQVAAGVDQWQQHLSSDQPPQQTQHQQQQQSPTPLGNGRLKAETGLDDALTVMRSHANGYDVAAADAYSVPSPATGGPVSVKSEDYSAQSPSASLGSPASGSQAAGETSTRKRKSGGANSSVSSTRGGNGVAAGPGGKRKKTEDMLDPVVRAAKERDRRFSNNTRERMRIRDINEALSELGRICMSLAPAAGGGANAAEKPQTKLGVLNLAVEVITHLEHKVRERNLNPSALVLQRGGPGALGPAGGHPQPLGPHQVHPSGSGATPTPPVMTMSSSSTGSAAGTPSPPNVQIR